MSAETQFWNWFERHEDDLFHFERNQEPTFDRLAAALGDVDPDLTFEFGPERSGVREIVTCRRLYGNLRNALREIR